MITSGLDFTLRLWDSYGCDVTCLTCKSPKETKSCLTCDFTLSNRENNPAAGCPCKEGYYEIGALVCEICDYKCKTCDTYSQKCNNCPDPLTSFRVDLSSTINLCPCLDGYYDDGFSIVCI